MEVLEIWLRLSRVKGISAQSCCIVADRFATDTPKTPALRKLGLSSLQIAQFWDSSQLDAELTWLQKQGNTLLPYSDPHYPPLLKQIAQPPGMLFISGNRACLAQKQIAIVGSRDYSDYGEYCTQYFAGELSASGLLVTSGLALGIDGIAHRACLAQEGMTIAVLGGGIAKISPVSHTALAQRIIQGGGAIVSEFAPLTVAKPGYFPQRNRIISGLSLGVLVVEAAKRSGSLITARWALEQGRDVYALPGRIDNPNCSGTHWLIQQGAYLVVQPADILEQLNGTLHWVDLVENTPVSVKSDHLELPFSKVLANVGNEVTSVDVVAERVGQSVSEIAVVLLDLELAGWIKAVSGGYVRLRRASHVGGHQISI